MKILVTGGAGYIGSHCVYELIALGHEVVVYDNLSNSDGKAVHNQAKLELGDIHDGARLDEVMSAHSFDAIIHFAASIVVSDSVRDPLGYYENNVVGVLSVLKAMVRNNIKNIVFSSTAAVYGNPVEVPCLETTPTNPESPYGETKLASERMIKWVAEANGLNYIVFRYFNVAGADKSGEIGLSALKITHIIPSAIEAVLGVREKLMIFGDDYESKDGTCVRDYIHVSDLATAHVLAVDYLVKEKTSQTINLGTNDGYSVKEIADTVREVCGPFKVEITERREGDPAVIVASNEKAKRLLGWEPKYTLEDMVRSDFAWRKKLSSK